MNREQLRTPITSFEPSPWDCSRCGRGRLVQSALNLEETAASIRVRLDDENWEFDWSEGRFVALLKCDNCGDPVAVAGNTTWDEDYDEGGPFPVEAYEPTYISPPIPLISTALLPPSVTEELVKSFALYWGDPAAAGNRIRCAVERMLDHHNIPKRFKNAKGKLFRPSLDGRIQRFEKKNPKHHTEIDRLHAIRWLGNAGSHGDLTHDDVVIAFEIIDAVFDAVYRPSTIDKKVKAILKKKGPTP